ncbi:MAG TPA: fructose 1,6-bisphosphatase, partial [Archaeoglobus profundus]|nr:fructose 1,6-bisphosphatase [Archaeoglobus profundus]
MGEKITVSVIKADVGSVAGHTIVPDEIKRVAEEMLEKRKKDGTIIDYKVFNAGDDLELVMTHRKGVD